jgi:hypothetical protein
MPKTSVKDMAREVVLVAMDLRDSKELPDDKYSMASELYDLALELEESIADDE